MAGDTQWLTTGQVATRVGYSIPWVREQINLGRLPARQFQSRQRRSIRVHRSDVERFIDHFLSSAVRD